MSIQNTISIIVNLQGDGASTGFNFDLATDPYTISVSGQIQNWFVGEKKPSLPVSVVKQFPNDPYSVSFSGTVVTVTFDVAPGPYPQAGPKFGPLFIGF